MFTGIIEETGSVRAVRQGDHSMEITIGSKLVLQDVKTGDSISTNGVCLTVIRFTPDSFTVEVMPETFRKTNLCELKQGNPVNLERALRLCDRLGGHLVSGHVDSTGTIQRIWKEGIAVRFRISADRDILKYIIAGGSVAIDGVSLTVTDTDDHSFGISVIPHTQKHTILLNKKAGEKVNIECDMIARYTEKLTNYNSERKEIDLDFLTNNGYL